MDKMTEDSKLLDNKILCKCGCNELIPRYDKKHRPRSFVKGHGIGRRPKPIQQAVICNCGCGTAKLLYDKKSRPRPFINGHQNRGRKYKVLEVKEGKNYCLCGCGIEIPWYGKRNRQRKYKLGHRLSKHGQFKSGKEHPFWNDGRTINEGGYKFVKVKGHPRGWTKSDYVREHVLVIEDYLTKSFGYKTYLDIGWDIHHKNKKKWDNRIENLQIMDPLSHQIHHLLEKKYGSTQY